MLKNAIRTAIVFVAFGAAAFAQTPVGPNFQVNSYTTGFQFLPSIGVEPDGDFVIVWSSQGQDGSDGGAFGQRFAASGAPRGSEFQINDYTTGFQGNPDVAVGSAGDFVVVWRSAQQDGSLYGVFGRRYDASGSPVGGEIQINTYTTLNQFGARVARAGDGRFVVAWTSQGSDGDSHGISARRFDSSGNPIGDEFVVNTSTSGAQYGSDVASDVNGNFVVTWQSYVSGYPPGSDVFGQRFDAAGNRMGAEFSIDMGLVDDKPSVSMSPSGSFVVAWTRQSTFYGQRDVSSTNVNGVVNTFTQGDQYVNVGAIAHDGGGNVIITWNSYGQDGDSGGIFGQGFDGAGGRLGAEFTVNAYTTGQQEGAAVGADAAGNFIVAWSGRNGQGQGHEVVAQRFSAMSIPANLEPASIAVDGTGNGVFQPNETVTVAPGWRNAGAAAVANVAGAASNFTGPPGPSYNLADGTATYGTIAPGATLSCGADCYLVGNATATRPALHWDTTFLETVSPGSATKPWTLHIGDSFTDVPPSNGFYPFIETILHKNVTGGCSATAYCPTASTTRAQMAVFVLVAREPSGYVPVPCGAVPMFIDVPVTSPFCRWVEEVARRGVVGGCGGGLYCPASPATREQMAVFVLRTLDPALVPPACATPIYNDVPATSGFCRWVEELTRRGVVAGCGGGNYCPAAPVTREQMGVFLSVAFGLTLYGP